MSDEKTIEIIDRLARIEQRVTDGFDGVHKRQDFANGRIAKTECEIQKLKATDIEVLAKFSNVLSYYNESKTTRNKLYWIWIERLVWVMCAVLLAILTRIGIINI